MKLKIILISITIIALFSCKKDNSQYTLDQSSLTLKVGQEHTFVMSKGGKTFSPNLFDWYSSNTDVGGVNAAGYFRAIATGKTTIKCEYVNKSTNERYSASCDLTVIN